MQLTTLRTSIVAMNPRSCACTCAPLLDLLSKSPSSEVVCLPFNTVYLLIMCSAGNTRVLKHNFNLKSKNNVIKRR